MSTFFFLNVVICTLTTERYTCDLSRIFVKYKSVKKNQVTPTNTGNMTKCFVSGKMSKSYTSCFSK